MKENIEVEFIWTAFTVSPEKGSQRKGPFLINFSTKSNHSRNAKVENEKVTHTVVFECISPCVNVSYKSKMYSFLYPCVVMPFGPECSLIWFWAVSGNFSTVVLILGVQCTTKYLRKFCCSVTGGNRGDPVELPVGKEWIDGLLNELRL